LKQPVDGIVNGRKIDMGLQRIAAIAAKIAASSSVAGSKMPPLLPGLIMAR
jgi:hypothetical protein